MHAPIYFLFPVPPGGHSSDAASVLNNEAFVWTILLYMPLNLLMNIMVMLIIASDGGALLMYLGI